MSDVEPQKSGLDFEIHHSSFDILRFYKAVSRQKLAKGFAPAIPPQSGGTYEGRSQEPEAMKQLLVASTSILTPDS